jgi:molybdopterin-guanine dinucleotide biosynthesis protein B
MFGKVIVAVVGNSNSGKTTAVEVLIKGLTKKGYKIASAKHIPDPEFTIDTKGKDTWKHARAGADTVLSVGQNELAVINRVDTTKFSLKQIVAKFSDETDIIILEGFKRLVGEDSSIPKIITANTVNDAKAAIGSYKNILAFIGLSSNNEIESEIPFIDILKEPEKLVDLVNQKVRVLVERKRQREEKITIYVNEELLPLGDFVQDILRNTVLAMVSSLKGVNKELTHFLNTKIKITIDTTNKGDIQKTSN